MSTSSLVLRILDDPCLDLDPSYLVALLSRFRLNIYLKGIIELVCRGVGYP